MTAEFIYPARGNFSYENNDQMINVFDTLYVEYSSVWFSLNLTLFCLEGTTSTQWQYLDVQGNPILASGTYEFGTIQAYNFSISQYPTSCHVKLTDFDNNEDALNGESFWVTSNSASSTTFQPTSTASSSGSSAATTQSAKSMGPVSVATTVLLLQTPTLSPTTNPPTSPTPAPSGLNTGAKAGIGAGAAAAALIISALLFTIWRMWPKAPANEQPALSGSALGFTEATTHAPIKIQPYQNEIKGSDRAELADTRDCPPHEHELSS